MTKQVVTSSDIQVAYEQLYGFLMDYLWEFKVVQSLANLEITIFKRFPDKDEMERYLRELKSSIAQTYNDLNENDRPDFKDAFDALETAIADYDNTGYELYSVQEVIDNPDDVEAAEDIDISTSETKEKFKFGKITKTTKEERELQEEAMNTLQNPFEEGED